MRTAIIPIKINNCLDCDYRRTSRFPILGERIYSCDKTSGVLLETKPEDEITTFIEVPDWCPYLTKED